MSPHLLTAYLVFMFFHTDSSRSLKEKVSTATLAVI